ncbi:MAG: thiolase family protein, partial [bacterium]|nr:thiolase family protein [bacterium]
GASMPALAAMSSRRYAYKYELSLEELRNMLAAVSIKNHKNAIHNPLAQFQKEINLEKYLSSKMISTPLCLYDCAAISDGAVAALISADPGPVRISGLGQAGDTLALSERDSFTSFSSTITAADSAYSMADLSPKDIDVVAIHDAFTMFEIVGTEDLGFFPPGRGGYAVLDGLTDLNGSIPVNPCGGLKARGHPVGASGLAQIHEIYRLLMENPGWDIGLTQSIGGLANNNLVCILEKVGHGKRVFGYDIGWRPREIEPHHPPKKSAFSDLFGLLSSKKGRIATFTTLYTVPEGFSEKELRIAVVKVKDGHHVMGIMLSPEDEYGIGTRVKILERDGKPFFEVR